MSEPGDPAMDEMSASVVALTTGDLDRPGRARLLADLAGGLRARDLGQLLRPRGVLRWVTERVSAVAPHLPVRDRETLRLHFPGLTDEQIIERLVRNAARGTAAIGAATGGAAAVEWVVTPTLLSAPVLLAVETVAVVAIELKLIGELHEMLGVPVPGSAAARGAAIVQAWASRRGVNAMAPTAGIGAVLGTAARRELRERLLRRFGRNLTSYGPLLTGAVVASYLNRKATLTLARQIRRDLERQLPVTP